MAHLKKVEKDLRRSRKADYEVTNDVNAAIFKNLHKLAKGQSAKLSQFNEKKVAQMQAAQKRLGASGRRKVRQFKKETQGAGSGVEAVLAGDIAKTAKAGKVAAKGHVRAGRLISEGTNELTQIFRAGTKRLSANADALAADALSQRAAADATTIAEMAHDERMLEMEQAFQREMAKKEFNRQKKLMGLEEEAAKKELGATFGQMKPAVTAFSAIVPEVLAMIANGDATDIETIKTALIEKGLLTMEDSQSPVIQRLLYNLSTNNQAGADDVIDEFIEAMSLTPQWSALNQKHRKRLKSYIKASLATTVSRYQQGEFSKEDDGDGGGIMDFFFGDRKSTKHRPA